MIFLSRARPLLAVLGMLLLGYAHAQPVLDRVRTARALKVCIWPEYYGVTYRHPRTQELSGIDIELAAALAADLNVRVEYVDSSFPTLVSDLVEDRCDVAMFAVGVTAQRAENCVSPSLICAVIFTASRPRATKLSANGRILTSPGCWSPFNPAPSWSR